MKILINTSNLYVGGGVQVALSFINELRYLKNNNKYFILISPVLKNQLEIEKFDNRFSFYEIPYSPAKLKYRLKINKMLNKYEYKINPDIVLTLFGPSYWKPKTMHVMGFADGWIYYKNNIAFKKLNKIKQLKIKFLNFYKIYYLKKDADYFILETEDAKKHFCKNLNIKNNKVFVVGNTYNSIFEDKNLLDINNPNYKVLPKSDKFRILYIAHNYFHKNIMILDKVLDILNNDKIEFVLTLNNKDYSKFRNKDRIVNVGPVRLKESPSLYHQCNAVISTSLLETFSAIYPEAMKMQKPILTSQYSFAKDICGDAALYFDPLDPKDIADKIKLIIENKLLRENLVKKGTERLKKFETAKSRAEKYLKICEDIMKGNIKI